MNIIRKIMGMPKKVEDSSRKVTNGVTSRSTISSLNKVTSKPASMNSGLASVKKESANVAAPILQTKLAEKQMVINSAPLVQTQSVKKEPAISETTNQAQLKQSQSVKQGAETLNPEASSSTKSVAVKKAAHEKSYTRTTSSFSAKEKGKAKVEETQDLGKDAGKEPKPEPEPVIKYHLQWDGTIFDEFAEEEEQEIHTCIICEQDLSSYRGDENGNGDEDEYGYYFETANLPEVGMLGCGHCYHAQCLESITPDDLNTDPPCLICLS